MNDLIEKREFIDIALRFAGMDDREKRKWHVNDVSIDEWDFVLLLYPVTSVNKL